MDNDDKKVQAVESTEKFEFYDKVQKSSDLLMEFNKKYKVNLQAGNYGQLTDN